MGYRFASLVVISLTLLFLGQCAACPPSFPNSLVVEEVVYSSPDLMFLDYSTLEPVTENYDARTRSGFCGFCDYSYFNYSGGYESMEIKIDDLTIFSGEISSLNTHLKNDVDDAGVSTYTFPVREINDFLVKETGDLTNPVGLKKYENSTLRIYLDEELVREYDLDYAPPIIIHCPSYGGVDDAFYLLSYLLPYILSAAAIAAIAIFAVRRRRHHS